MLTKCPSRKIIHKMGLIKDQEGIMRRYIRESGNWNSHLIHTKEFIIKNLIEFKPRKIAVLGSGWLLDIPLKHIIDTCERVFFYDICHPPQIIHKYRQFNQFKFIEIDLTGGFIEKTYSLMRNKKSCPEVIEDYYNPVVLELPYEADLLFSVNVLNQLDILIIDNLKKGMRIHSESIRKIRSQIQGTHMQFLTNHKACLITDYEELHLDESGKKIKEIPLLYAEIPETKIKEKWRWKFDNYYTYHENCLTHFNVLAAKY